MRVRGLRKYRRLYIYISIPPIETIDVLDLISIYLRFEESSRLVERPIDLDISYS